MWCAFVLAGGRCGVEMVIQVYMNGYSLADLGAFSDGPVSTVKHRLHAARTKLRERMMAMVEETPEAARSG
jgi:DNA-directed RNA polymerase specialized sigma24 family protein